MSNLVEKIPAVRPLAAVVEKRPVVSIQAIANHGVDAITATRLHRRLAGKAGKPLKTEPRSVNPSLVVGSIAWQLRRDYGRVI